jgi:integrase
LTTDADTSGRKWRVTSLVARGVPINKIADVVGHASVATTLGYLGRQDRSADPQVIAAL